jgi:acyl dehydratase
MAIAPRHLFDREFPVLEHRYTQRDTQLYALGVGVGCGELVGHALRYVYEGADGASLRALPTQVNVLAYPGFWAREPDTGIDWRRVVHAEQQIEWHATLPVEGVVIGRNRVSGLWDKGLGRGALMQQTRELSDGTTGRPLATVTQLSFLRGDGGFGPGGSEGEPPTPHTMPSRAPDVACALPTSRQSALLYRLCGDANPLHADPQVAREAGFERPLLHGMAVMGVAAHAVLHSVLDHDTARLAGMRVRFTAPALPGDTLHTDIWVDGATVSLRCTADERGVVVLDHGRVTLH